MISPQVVDGTARPLYMYGGAGKLKRRIYRKRSEDKNGKGPIKKQSREEKPKAEKNKKKATPVSSVFGVRMIGKDASRRKFS
jgi:hypothetical protein